jgi:hypothetical protein
VTQLYLDDLRPCPEGSWIVCRSAEDAKEYILAHGCPALISFDHDLGDQVETGYDLAKWLVEQDMDREGKLIPGDFEYRVHSANPVGATNIRGYLDNYLPIRHTLFTQTGDLFR